MIDCMVNPAPVFMGLEESVAPAAGGGGGFTAFTDDFSGDLSLWTKVGTSAIVSGQWRVSATTAAIWATDYAMPETEGSWDLDVKLTRSGTFEHQIAVYADATLATKADPYRTNAGKGYVLRITSGAIALHKIDTTETSIKTYTGGVTSGSVVTLRASIAANGDRTFEVLVGGSSRGTHTVAQADLVAGIGTIFGISCFAAAGQTTDADDVSFDVTA